MTLFNPLNTERKKLKSQEWKWWLYFFMSAGIMLYLLRIVLIPFFIAGALSYLLSPIVDWLVYRIHLPRWLSILIVYLALIGTLAAVLIFLGPTLEKQTVKFVDNLPQTAHQLITNLFGGNQIKFMGKTITADDVLQRISGDLKREFGSFGLLKPVIIGVGLIGSFFLSLALLLFLLIGGPQLKTRVLQLFPSNRRAQIRFFAVEIDNILGRYVRGLAGIIAYAGLTTWIGLSLIIKVPYAFPIAVFTGMAELVPIIGAVLSFILSSAAAFISGGFMKMIEAGCIYGVMRLTTDNFVAPLILGRAVILNPIVVIFAFLAGGALFGLLGFLIAIPVAASIRVVITTWPNAPKLQR